MRFKLVYLFWFIIIGAITEKDQSTVIIDIGECKNVNVVIYRSEMREFFRFAQEQEALNPRQKTSYYIDVDDPQYDAISKILDEYQDMFVNTDPHCIRGFVRVPILDLGSNSPTIFAELWNELSNYKSMELLICTKYDQFIGQDLPLDETIGLPALKEMVSACQPGDCPNYFSVNINLTEQKIDQVDEDPDIEDCDTITVLIDESEMQQYLQAAQEISRLMPQRVELCMPAPSFDGFDGIDFQQELGIVFDDEAYPGYYTFELDFTYQTPETSANLWQKLHVYGPVELWLSGGYTRIIGWKYSGDSINSKLISVGRLLQIIRARKPGKHPGYFNIKLVTDYEESNPSMPGSPRGI